MGRLVRKRALSGRINPMIMSENMIGFTRVTRAKPSWRHADTIQSLSSLDERGPMRLDRIRGAPGRLRSNLLVRLTREDLCGVEKSWGTPRPTRCRRL